MSLRTNAGSNPEAGLLSAAVEQYASGTEQERGAVFTRREVVDLILDLVGYVESEPLHQMRLLEPSAGEGDFLLPAVGRLVRSYLAHGGTPGQAPKALGEAIKAFEVHPASFDTACAAVTAELVSGGIPKTGAAALAKRWLVIGDYLLSDHGNPFTHVVGNPPYVRQELIPEALLARYRKRFRTLYDRADLYVLFYEHSLNALAPSGRLGFICADRWTKNKYGGPLRSKVSADFALTHYVDLVGTPAFHSDVIAYPAVTVLERRPDATKPVPATRMAYRPTISEPALASLSAALTAPKIRAKSGVVEVPGVVQGSEPWLLDQPERLALVRRLEAALPALEDAGCRVGIGVATGADGVYIQPFDELDVEPSRKLPIVRTQDIQSGHVEWKGLGVINPFLGGGGVVDLDDFPKLARYLQQHATTIKKRNVSQRNPKGWFRTIDRIYPALAATPKLLIPDIKGDAHVVYEDGQLYPHLNLITQLVQRNGLARAKIHLERRLLTLPGYFRPTKMWDVLIMDGRRLIAALELKSQVGPSFGNNFNNRTEEAIGTSHDFWVAYREGALGDQPKPFVGWLMLVEDCERSRTPVRDASPHFPVFKEFESASYAKRYEVLCRRLVQEQLYTQAALLLSPREAVTDGRYTELSETTSLTNFVAGLAGHVAAVAAVARST